MNDFGKILGLIGGPMVDVVSVDINIFNGWISLAWRKPTNPIPPMSDDDWLVRFIHCSKHTELDTVANCRVLAHGTHRNHTYIVLRNDAHRDPPTVNFLTLQPIGDKDKQPDELQRLLSTISCIVTPLNSSERLAVEIVGTTKVTTRRQQLGTYADQCGYSVL